MSEQQLNGASGVEPKNNSRVSIGMPVYNGEKYIREALDSLLAQTFPDFELIISDNASIDGTEAICLEYAQKDSRIRYVRHQENRGACTNFQFVLNEAKGEFFMWTAHDDQWHPDFLMTCVHNLDLHKESDLAFCTYALCDRNGEMVHVFPEYTRFISKYRLLSVCRFVYEPDILGKVTLIYGVYRRTICKKILEFRSLDFDEYWGCDNHFVLALISRHNIAIDKRVLFYKRDVLEANELKEIYVHVNEHSNQYMMVPIHKSLNYLKGQLSVVKGTPYFWPVFVVGLVRVIVTILYKIPAKLHSLKFASEHNY